jgi:uncharacterized protein YdeI (BOF family)
MKNRIQSLWYLGTLVLFLGVGISLNAQQTTPQSPSPANDQQSDQASPPAQTQQPAQQQAPPDRAAPPDGQAQTAPTAEGQSFTGTIVKSGDKYVFQDATSGNTYDIDHQADVQKFEGKRVKVHGTLDEANHMIHIQ